MASCSRCCSVPEVAARTLQTSPGACSKAGAASRRYWADVRADELARARGVGPARAARLAAALEIGRRYLEAPQDPRSALEAPLDAARFFKARLLDLPQKCSAACSSTRATA